MAVLAEHPSELVRDQYLMMVADRLRLDHATLRPRVAELVRNPELRARDDAAPAPRARTRPRPPASRCLGPASRHCACASISPTTYVSD